MRVDDLIEILQNLSKKHGNKYVIIDSNYDGEVSVGEVGIVPYHETEYIVIKP